MSDTSLMAPSIDLVMAIPSLEFLMAMFNPLICAVIRWVIARPAASSDALLIFEPVESRSIAVSNSFFESAIARCAVKEETLVLIERAMINLPLLVCFIRREALYEHRQFCFPEIAALRCSVLIPYQTRPAGSSVPLYFRLQPGCWERDRPSHFCSLACGLCACHECDAPTSNAR